MSTRPSRLFALAEALRARKTGVTAEELAERFEVSVRTIYRDLDALATGGLPLLAERGRGGGYALDRDYSLPPVNFTAREAAVLTALGRWAEQMRFMPFIDTLKSAIDKARSALSASEQRALVIHARTLTFTGVPALPTTAKVRKVIEAAWFTGKPARITYVDRQHLESHRTIAVRGILMERNETHVIAHDLDKDDGRRLRLDRILRAELIETSTTPPTPRRRSGTSRTARSRS